MSGTLARDGGLQLDQGRAFVDRHAAKVRADGECRARAGDVAIGQQTLFEALGPEQQLADDEQRPALADDVELAARYEALRRAERALAGGMGPEGKDIPNLTPANLKKYSDADLKNLLTTGLTADGDVLAEAMGEVVTNTISQMSSVDLDAMVAYLRSLPSIADEKSGKK